MANITKRKNKAGVSYLIRAFVAWGADGKQKTKSMTWKPPKGMKETAADKQAEKEGILFEEKVKSGTVTIDGRIKFADYAARWMETTELAPKTVRLNRYILGRVNKAIGHIPLEKLRADHIKQFIKNLREDGINERSKCVATDNFREAFAASSLSQREFKRRTGINETTLRKALDGKYVDRTTTERLCTALGVKVEDMFTITNSKLADTTIHRHYTFIQTILSTAKKNQIIPRNVIDFMDAPKIKKKEARYLDDEQAKVFLAEVIAEPDIRIKAAFIVLLFTGARNGELCGLEWNDIDFAANIIHVRRASQYVPGHGIIEVPTKTDSSMRSITVTPFVMQILSDYRLWWEDQRELCGDSWRDEKERLFTKPDGAPLHPTTVNYWLSRFIEKTNTPYISPHSLRHTFVTLQIAAGVDIRTLQARSGHARVQTLLGVYTHVVQNAQGKAAAAMDKMLLPTT